MSDKELSRDELLDRIERYSEAIQQGATFSESDFLEIGRLWNTLSFHTRLLAIPVAHRFFEMVRDTLLPDMITALKMRVGRGYSFYSDTLDFALGGLLDERYRYRLEPGVDA